MFWEASFVSFDGIFGAVSSVGGAFLAVSRVGGIISAVLKTRRYLVFGGNDFGGINERNYQNMAVNHGLTGNLFVGFIERQFLT